MRQARLLWIVSGKKKAASLKKLFLNAKKAALQKQLQTFTAGANDTPPEEVPFANQGDTKNLNYRLFNGHRGYLLFSFSFCG